ncbi:MAG: hypothetical protein ABWZ99_16115 [Ilumatobacteraceae bacterium]
MWSPVRQPPPDQSIIDQVNAILDPILGPLGFAPGQGSVSGQQGQVIFCSGEGCVDLVVDLEASPGWRISDVRYWGFPSDRWHLDFDADADLADQLDHLVRTLPIDLADAAP